MGQAKGYRSKSPEFPATSSKRMLTNTGTQASTEKSVNIFSSPTPAGTLQIAQDPIDRFNEAPPLHTQGGKRKGGHKSKLELEPCTQKRKKIIVPTSVPATLKKAAARMPPRTQEPRMTKEAARVRVGTLIYAIMQQSSTSNGHAMSSMYPGKLFHVPVKPSLQALLHKSL